MNVRLELENIGILRGRATFNFRNGLNVIYAPNASGKTSVVTALKIVSIEKLDPREIARALNDYEDKGSVRLVIDGEEYSVELLRKPGGVEAIGKRLVKDGVTRILAFLDLENPLVNAVFSGDEERVREILRETTGITYIEKILSVLESMKNSYEFKYNLKKREYESKVEEVEAQKKNIEARLREVRKRIDEIMSDSSLEPVRKKIEEIMQGLEKISNEMKEERIRASDAKAKIGLLETDITSLMSKLEVLREEKKKLEEEIAPIKNKLIDTRREIERLENKVKVLEAEKNGLQSEIREIEDIISKRRQVLAYARCPYCGGSIDRSRIESEIHNLEEEHSDLMGKLANIVSSINNIRDKIEVLRRSIEEELKRKEEELKKVNKEIDELQRKITRFKNEYNALKKEVEEIEEKIRNLELRRKMLSNELEKLKDKAPLVEELRRLQDENDYLTKQLDNIYIRLRAIQMTFKELLVLEDRIEKCSLLYEYFSERLGELGSKVVEDINRAVLKHFKLLRLAELEYPILANDLSLSLVRVGGTPTSLGELSDAERSILTILLTLTLKEYVMPEFPFYVVDSLIEFIDDARAEKIQKYLAERMEDKVVILTKTKPFTGESIHVTQRDIVYGVLKLQ